MHTSVLQFITIISIDFVQFDFWSGIYPQPFHEHQQLVQKENYDLVYYSIKLVQQE